MSVRSLLVASIRRFALLGVSERDDDGIRAQKATLTIAAAVITIVSVFWVGIYALLGLYAAAAIPLLYQVGSVAALVAFAWTKSYRLFRFSQAVMMSLLPFILQWTLGGYAASSAVSLWSLTAAIGTLFFFTADESIPWFAAFIALTVISGFLDPMLAQHAAVIPDPIRTAFFVLNVGGASVTAYLMLQFVVRARDDAYARSEGLLLNILPPSIAVRLKREPGVIADSYPDVAVLFADVVDFTPFAERVDPDQVVVVLDTIFSAFDALADRYGVEKIKTIGDAYMVAGGLPDPRPGHLEAIAEMALDMQAEMRRLASLRDVPLRIRIGVDAGPVVAGVIGRNKFTYDLWGDAVNTASRMESHGLPGQIQVSERVHDRLSSQYAFEARGPIQLKGKGLQPAWLLVGRLDHAAAQVGLPKRVVISRLRDK